MSIVVLQPPSPGAGLWSVACNFEDCENVWVGGVDTKARLRALTEADGWHWMRELHMCPACLATQKPSAVEPPPAKSPKKGR